MDKKQFKEMPLRKKLRWLFDYYSITVIVIAVILAAAVFLLKSLIWSEKPEDVCVLIYSDAVTQEQCLVYENDIENNTGKSASVQVYNISDPYGSQAFSAKIGCDLIDLVIAPKKEMELMSDNGFLLDFAPVEGSTMYMGIPRTAREGSLLQEVIDYLNAKLAI